MPNHIKFTDLTLRALRQPGSYWDDSLPAFGLSVGKRATTFIVVREGKRKRLGRYPQLALHEARHQAKAELLQASTLAPKESGTKSVAIGAKEAVEEYLKNLNTRSRTRSDYCRRLHFAPALGHQALSE